MTQRASNSPRLRARRTVLRAYGRPHPRLTAVNRGRRWTGPAGAASAETRGGRRRVRDGPATSRTSGSHESRERRGRLWAARDRPVRADGSKEISGAGARRGRGNAWRRRGIGLSHRIHPLRAQGYAGLCGAVAPGATTPGHRCGDAQRIPRPTSDTEPVVYVREFFHRSPSCERHRRSIQHSGGRRLRYGIDARNGATCP